MKIVILGSSNIAWGELRQVLATLGADDEVVVNGAAASAVEFLVKQHRRDHRQRPPTFTVQRAEVPRYEPDQARTQLAMQLIAYHAPAAVVLVGEPDPLLQEEVMRFAAAHLPRPVPVWTAGEFVHERTSV
jgi:hypothetical protein